ncbi:AAA family ATPase [Arthrobacter sp. NPDC089319]|uniref:AAA family ATPase n=1 Tax=Arthrobacter sp. NPDC089319 TaxID=3155915 RepID=UPI00341966DA
MASPRMKLRHLTFLGRGVDPASIDFNERLTAIVGPSDTGKSFILDSINYALGGKELRSIPEVEGYTHLLLGFSVDGTIATLLRPLNGGKFELYNSDVRDFPTSPADRVLKPVHNAEKEDNLSNYLLTELGFGGRRVRTNERNTTRGLSFRDLVQLCVISEGSIQAEAAPALTGQRTSATVEKSVLKLLLEDEDDAALVEAPSQAEEKLSRGKSALLDQIVAKLSSEISDLPSDASQQLIRLNASIAEHYDSIQEKIAERDAVLNEREIIRADLSRHEERFAELEELAARFGLLSNQYHSDIQRLEMVAEGGTLLGLFEPEICMLCGAQKEHQQHGPGDISGPEMLREAAVAEMAKTAGLLLDLEATIESMVSEKRDTQQTIYAARQTVGELGVRVSELDRNLSPKKKDLLELTAAKSRIERALSAQEQIRSVESLRSTIELDAMKPAGSAGSGNDEAKRELAALIAEILNSWGMAGTNTARLDENAELIVDGRPRSSRGKGTRALLHSAFSLALATFCMRREQPHPGFVVLDSPLVTYRQPDPGEDETIPSSVSDSFYRYLATEFEGQAIVLENQDPPADVSGDTTIITFTKREGQGRYGLLGLP